MSSKRNFLLVLPIIGAALLAFRLSSYAQTEISSDDCLACHEDYDLTLSAGSHQLIDESTKNRVRVMCVSCHAAGEAHLDDPTTENTSVPSNLNSEEEARLCAGCHTAHVELDNYGYDVHLDLEFNCSSCHRVHNSDLLSSRSAGVMRCVTCHDARLADFSKRSNHPLLQGNLTCLSCHKFTRRQDSGVSYDINRVCQDCHPEQGGPFPFEHDAANAYLVEGSGCMGCHSPHGSENDRLLTQPGSALCERCHVSPPLHDTQHGGVARNRTCQSCHTGVHGSFVSSHLLDVNLASIAGNGLDCYESGCHELGE